MTDRLPSHFQHNLNKELSDAMAEPLVAVEAVINTGSSHEKAAAKQRRLALKEDFKMVSNPQGPGRFVLAVRAGAEPSWAIKCIGRNRRITNTAIFLYPIHFHTRALAAAHPDQTRPPSSTHFQLSAQCHDPYRSCNSCCRVTAAGVLPKTGTPAGMDQHQTTHHNPIRRTAA